MIKTKWMKKLLTALCVVAIALVAVVSFPGAEVAKADNISVSNGDFSSYSSDLAPNNWTKSGDTGANIFTGVYDGKVGFDKHGFSDVGLLEHGTAARDFLVINSKDTKAYSAYASADITVSPSSYYQFTVKAKADITVGGAYFSITGLGEEISLPIATNGVWTTYKIYLATGFNTSGSVKISLSLGKDNAEAKGWVMFDDVSAESLTYRDYATIEHADNILVKDVNIPYVDGMIEGGDFFTLDNTKWTVGGDKVNSFYGIESTNTQLVGKEDIVIAPNFDGSENNFLHIASVNDEATYVTVTSNQFTVKPDEFYRISYYVLDDGTLKSGTNVANAKLYYKYASSSAEFKSVTVNNIQSATANASHFGWTEREFYVKGSAFTDVVCKLEFSIGEEGTPVKGGVFIDDVRVQKLTAKQYSDASPDASVTVKADSGITDSTGVTNGAFYSYDITDGKLIPTGWNKIVAGDSNTNGYGYSSVKADDSDASYEVVKASDPEANVGAYECAMKMSSSINTAFAMQSSAISVASGKYQLINVNLSAMNVTGSGASIVIRRSNGAVVAVKENITAAGTYAFCIKGDSSESTSVYAEIWLGMFDRNSNRDKLASGTVYVKTVTAAESSEEVYNAYAASTSNNQIACSVASADAWIASDANDNILSNWTVSSAVKGAKVEYVASELDGEKVIRLTNVSPNASTISLTPSKKITSSSYYKVTVQLKIIGSLDDVDANQKGYKGVRAGIITGDATTDTTKYVVSDIKETTLKTDKYNYVTIEFFIKGGKSDANVTLFVGMGENVTVAEGKDPVPYTAGTVYIKGVSLESSSTTEYTNAKNDLKDTQVLVNLSDTDDDKKDNDTEKNTSSGIDTTTLWLMIGSIIFALALIAVLIVYFVRKYQKKHPKKPAPVKGRPSYDRANLSHGDKKAEKATDEKTGAVEQAEDVDKFSDENEEANSTEEAAENAEQTSEETAENAEENEQAVSEETAEAPAETTEETPAKTAEEAPAEEKTENTDNTDNQ
ncbi:MAG: hypothetical protein KH405_04440 [Firmicutes bacterium]|nr:hypothetical protein [Bacillota bacterium]